MNTVSSSSLSNMIAKTDEYESILAWNELEQKHYSVCHRRRGDYTTRNPSLSLLLKNGNAEKVSTWCRNVIDHFNLPRYLVEWTMNFIHRYSLSQQTKMNAAITNTHTLKTMTAVALRLCIRLDAGQSIYSRPYSNKSSPTSVNLDHQQKQQQHIDAMTTIPHLVSKSDNKPMTIECLHQMFYKLEIVLMKSLGFYLHPPLTEHYIEEICKITESLALRESQETVLNMVLQQIKKTAILLAQSSSLRQSNHHVCSFENEDEDDIITPSSCSISICSYLGALKIYAIQYYNVDIAIAEHCKAWYKGMLDAFVDVIVRTAPSWPKDKNVEMIEAHIECLVMSSEAVPCCHVDQDQKQHKDRVIEVTPRLSQKNNNIEETHHRRQAATVAITSSPILLGKRKASPTSVIMITKQNDDDNKNDGSSVPITSPMKKVSLNHSDE